MCKLITYLTILILLCACEPVEHPVLKSGDCVLGAGMGVWKLIREDHGEYLFETLPERLDSTVELVEDLSTLKKIECPG